MAVDMTRQTAKNQNLKVMAKTHALIVFLCLPFYMGHLPSAFAAENLLDPTRPPAEFAAPSAATASAATGPLLQSVLISKGRKSAIIGGQVVGLGEKYGEARVVKITESEVVLKTGTVTETLRLFPDVEKRSVQGRKK